MLTTLVRVARTVYGNLPGSVMFNRVFLEITLRSVLDFEDAYLDDGSSNR